MKDMENHKIHSMHNTQRALHKTTKEENDTDSDRDVSVSLLSSSDQIGRSYSFVPPNKN